MKKPLLRILKLSIPLLILVFMTAAAEMNQIESDEVWSVDGGVFHPKTHTLPNDVERVMVKGSNGTVRLLNLQNNAKSSEPKALQVFVDRTPPEIKSQWSDVDSSKNQLTIGPNSELQLTIEGGEIHELITEAQVNTEGNATVVIDFNDNSDSLNIIAVDAFGNSSEEQFTWNTDFSAPEVEWELLSPAINNNGTWFAGRKANMIFQAVDESGIDKIQVNGQQVADNNQSLEVATGDELLVTDSLGNQTRKLLAWEEDNQAPKLFISGDAAELNKGRNITVAVNQVFELNAGDDGVGIHSKLYKGVERQWQPLPKKFRFLNKGNYRINVKLEDRVGNVFEKTVKVKVRR